MQKNNYFSLSILTSLFFMMGLLTVLNDTLIPHLKELFELTYFQSSLIQFCFFGAYFITSSFFGKLIQKIGYQASVSLGFFIAACGCLLFYPAAKTQVYTIFLAALFVLASGVVLLQVTGNPFVTLLSKKEDTARNLALVQAFNSLGTTVGPIIGFYLILENANTIDEKIWSIQQPYLIIAIFLIFLALFVKFVVKLPDTRVIAEEISQTNNDTRTSAWQYAKLRFGALGIFCYVGAEVAIGSFLMLYLMEIANYTKSEAAHYLSYYWGLAMCGRFVGGALLNKCKASALLAICALMNVLVILLIVCVNLNAGCMIFIGLFNSIMFPTIFSLATKDLGRNTSQASGIICIAIFGGAIIPPVQALIMDYCDMNLSYIVPALCYLYILLFARKADNLD